MLWVDQIVEGFVKGQGNKDLDPQIAGVIESCRRRRRPMHSVSPSRAEIIFHCRHRTLDPQTGLVRNKVSIYRAGRYSDHEIRGSSAVHYFSSVRIISSALIFLFAVASFAFAEPAHAKYSLCNKTSYAVRAAIGFVDGDRLATRGWWPLNPGQCKIVLTDEVNPGRYFVYAEAIDGHKGPKKTWSGETALCVENTGLFNQRNQDVCRDSPQNQRKFKDVEVTSASNGTWTTDFVEAQNLTIYSAKVAGVQRLLADVGQPIKSIDGTMGQETRRAIAAYRKNRGLTDGNNIDDELIESLIDEANRIDQKLGFFYCNKTGEDVWSAIGFPGDGDSYVSQGWWQLRPGQCVKVIKGELMHDHYYVFGVVGGGEDAPERILAGGDKELCVNDVIFNTTDDATCADQDLNAAMFKRVEIGTSPAATYDFLPDAFIVPSGE